MSSSSTDGSFIEDPVGAQLDDEIMSLQAQISSLKSQRALQASTILSSYKTRSILKRFRASQRPSKSRSNRPLNPEKDTAPLLSMSSSQLSHNLQNLYRACGSITTFRIRDPDPNAVDNGNVLGLRIDLSSRGKFVMPYYVMLNKPFDGEAKDLLRIHRHTVPPCIPLASLADMYMPCGKGAVAMGKGKEEKSQDLKKFMRALRREIVGYHNRISAIMGLRKGFRLDMRPSKKGKDRERIIADVSAADAEAKQVRIEWVDGRIGRALIGEKGEVVRCVVFGDKGRDVEAERAIVGDGRGAGMLGIGERLSETIY